jgi:hypothetical protein
MKYVKFLFLIMFLISGCKWSWEGTEAQLLLDCNPGGGYPAYYGGHYHWAYSIYLEEYSGNQSVEIRYFQYQVFGSDGSLIEFRSGNCGFVREFWGQNSCRIQAGGFWQVQRTFSYVNLRPERIEFLLIGFDEAGVKHEKTTSFWTHH